MLSLVQTFIYNTTRTYYLHSNELKYFFSPITTQLYDIIVNAIFCTHLTYKTYKLFKVLSRHSSNSIYSNTIQKSYANLVGLISVETTAVR